MQDPKTTHKLHISIPTGWNLMSPHTTLWFGKLMYEIGRTAPTLQPSMYSVNNSRILMCRNMAVQDARQSGATHLLFVDPDMCPDYYVEWDEKGNPAGDAKPFFREAWAFAQAHPGGVYAAPYCGVPPKEHIHVFAEDQNGVLARLPHDQAKDLRGWMQVAAVGTGLMLIDMAVFDALDQKTPNGEIQPHFMDVYTDSTYTKLRWSQDVTFCKRCTDAGVPVYVNFDCWCRHQQFKWVGRPGDPGTLNTNGPSEDRACPIDKSVQPVPSL